jgi:hypothetical protein
MAYPDDTTINAVAYFFDENTQVLGLPDRKYARFFLKEGTAKTRWADSAGYYPAFKVRAKAFKFLLRILVSLFPRFFYFLRTNKTPPQEVPFSFAKLKKEFPSLDRNVVMLGAIDDNRRKTIVCLKDGNGVSIAYIKWGSRPMAQKKILNEGRMLTLLPEYAGPEVLKEWDIEEARAICISSVIGEDLPKFLPEASNRIYWDDVVSFLSKLSEGAAMANVHDHPWIRGLMQRTSFDFSEVLNPLEQQAWPIVVCHGDFTPWNLLRDREGHLIAIDWEDGSAEGFLWMDLVYYVIQTGALMHKWSSFRIRDYLSKLLHYYGVKESEAQSIIQLVALDAYLKGSEDGVSPDCHLQKVRINLWECV